MFFGNSVSIRRHRNGRITAEPVGQRQFKPQKLNVNMAVRHPGIRGFRRVFSQVGIRTVPVKMRMNFGAVRMTVPKSMSMRMRVGSIRMRMSVRRRRVRVTGITIFMRMANTRPHQTRHGHDENQEARQNCRDQRHSPHRFGLYTESDPMTPIPRSIEKYSQYRL